MAATSALTFYDLLIEAFKHSGQNPRPGTPHVIPRPNGCVALGAKSPVSSPEHDPRRQNEAQQDEPRNDEGKAPTLLLVRFPARFVHGCPQAEADRGTLRAAGATSSNSSEGKHGKHCHATSLSGLRSG